MHPDLLELRLTELSERIKLGREASGLTLGQLSKRSGVATSTILKIESRQMIPSVAVIMKIAGGLRIDVGELIAPKTSVELDVVEQRAGTHARLADSNDLVFEKLSADILGSDLQYWRVQLGPLREVKFFQPQAFHEQIALGERGAIEMNLDGSTFTIKKGDSLHVRDRHLLGLRNPEKSASSYLVTGTLPQGEDLNRAFHRNNITMM